MMPVDDKISHSTLRNKLFGQHHGILGYPTTLGSSEEQTFSGEFSQVADWKFSLTSRMLLN